MNESTARLLAEWKRLVESIVAFEYDCSFEWRGETDSLHDSYLEDLQRFQQEAEGVLRLALQDAGSSREKLLEQAGEVCSKCEEDGGWGAKRCWDSINAAVFD